MKIAFTILFLGYSFFITAQPLTICELNQREVSSFDEAQTIQVQGLVTGVFNGKNQLDRVFIQSKNCENKNVSIGLCIIDKKKSLNVSVGNQIMVEGNIQNSNGQIQLINPKLLDKKEIEMLILPIQLDENALKHPEKFQNMYVQFKGEWTVADNYNASRYGQVLVSSSENEKQVSELKHWLKASQEEKVEINNIPIEGFVIDDGSLESNPFPLPYFNVKDSTLKRGSKVIDPVGIWYRHKGTFMLEPTMDITWQFKDRGQFLPEKKCIRIVSYNLLNWFSTIDDGKNRARGADNEEEQKRQLKKLVAAITTMDAELYGFVELENNRVAASKLLEAINKHEGKERYALIEYDRIGRDKIKAGMMYDKLILEPVDSPVIYENSIYSRPPLAQRFKLKMGEQEIWFIMNHFKSKRCGKAEGADANQRDGQACWNAKRTEQSKLLYAFQDSLRIAYPANVILAGDFNAYSLEDPIQFLEKNGFERAIKDDYTYVYKGRAGMLDHFLIESELSEQIHQAFVWHINSDEPRFIDYNMEFNGDKYYSPNEYRSSDHDPIILDLDWK